MKATWINFSERPPPKDKSVFCECNSGEFLAGQWDGVEWWDPNTGGGLGIPVFKWLEICDEQSEIELIEKITAHFKTQPSSDPEYLQMSSPLNEKEGWILKVMWDHHDGEINEYQTTNVELVKALNNIWEYLKKRDNINE